MGNVQTYTEIVEATDAAILALMNGGAVQNYTLAGRSISKYSLRELKELRDDYASMVADESSGGGVVYPDFR
jgi:hypothetical protein